MKTDSIAIFPLGFPWETEDPFLFCVHHLDHYPKGNSDMGPDASLSGRPLGNDFVIKDGWRMYHGTTIPGFPSHPHRGFETITIVTKGYCDHSDSLGASARFGNGDVQWMTAGRGVQHSEMFPLLREDAPNTLELFQIWLNLPAAKKMAEPHFKMLWNKDIPQISDSGWELRLISGLFSGKQGPEAPPDSWAADPDNGVLIALVSLEPGAVFEIPAASKDSKRRIFMLEGGEIDLGGQTLQTGLGAKLPASSLTLKNGAGNARFLWLEGKPISEPVAKYGPFVMNDSDEIQRAMNEYQLTRFGGWPWPYPDNVHPREKGRFAQYPDGKIIEP
ncbi:pirin family protein [Robiginitalea aurantiaca]|uniref:Pirin family protein n=1 Tax=Robiginitalea aurantiaca TaxID=3056915 RepID=A0ABT7WH61_9FLAO|nr:pirin family protein [Robiginitalea aurantiaca]MDM9632198.1 pirin family protein [Robiginitalea aurantiaca]